MSQSRWLPRTAAWPRRMAASGEGAGDQERQGWEREADMRQLRHCSHLQRGLWMSAFG
jgi:hypothetical protein